MGSLRTSGKIHSISSPRRTDLFLTSRFHVDDLSSAHVYLRMPPGKTIEDIPEGVLEDCLQLVKQNSIEGCKLDNVPIVYTPWSNLKKTKCFDSAPICLTVV